MPKIYLNDAERGQDRVRKWWWIKKAECDLTDSKLAKKLGVSRQAVSKKLKRNGTGQADILVTDLLVMFRETHATDEEILKLMRI